MICLHYTLRSLCSHSQSSRHAVEGAQAHQEYEDDKFYTFFATVAQLPREQSIIATAQILHIATWIVVSGYITRRLIVEILQFLRLPRR